MLICKKDNTHYVNIHLDVIPAYIEFIIDENVYKFSLENKNIGDICSHENEISNWIDRNFDKIKEIIWEWNIGKNEVELIEDYNF